MSKQPEKPKPKRKRPPKKRKMTTKAKKAKTGTLRAAKLKQKRPVPAKKRREAGRNGVRPTTPRLNGTVTTLAETKLEELAETTAEAIHDIIEVGSDGKHTRRSLQRMMQVDYIQDPDRCTLKKLHADATRPYGGIPWQTVRSWSAKDGWEERRKEYWSRVTQYALNRFMQESAHSLMREIDRVSESIIYMEEYMLPLKDGRGKVQRHKTGALKGLPVYPLVMPSQEKMVDMLLKLYKHRLGLVGAAGAKGEDTLKEATMHDVPVAKLDPVAHSVKLNAEELDALADSLLRMRQEAAERPEPEAEDGD